MKALSRSLILSGVAAVGIFGLGAVPARAQGFGFGYSSPGVSFGLGTGGYSGAYYGGYGSYGGYGAYPYVAPPIVVPGPVVVPRTVVVPGPIVVPRGGYYYGPRYYGGAYRGFPRRYRY